MKLLARLLFILLFAWPLQAANKFVWSGATGADNGSQWEDAYVSGMRDWGAEGGFTPGTDFVYFRSIHAETSATSLSLTGSTAEGTSDPVRIVSVVGADTGTSPGNYAPGATVTTTATSADIDILEKLAVFGVEFHSNDDIRIPWGSNDLWFYYEDGRLELTGTSTSDILRFGLSMGGAVYIHLKNVDMDFGNALQGIDLSMCTIVWDGGTVDFNVSNFIEKTGTRQSIANFRNLDLSILTGNIASSAWDVSSTITFERCLLNAGATLVGGLPDVPGGFIRFHHCQSGTDSDPAFQMAEYSYQGNIKVDTARYRDDGATDGIRSTGYSWELDTTSAWNVIELYEPLCSSPVSVWSAGNGATSHTYRAYVANGAGLNDDDVWLEGSLVNDAAIDSLGIFKTTRAGPQDTPAALTSDTGSTWNGSGVGTKYQIDITHTPDKPGVAIFRVCLAKPSTTIYFDPKIAIDP